MMDSEDGSSDNIRDEEEQNKVTESSFIADFATVGVRKVREQRVSGLDEITFLTR